MNKKAAFIKYIHSLGNSTPEDKFTGTILTLNRNFPYSDQDPGSTDLYDEEMTLQTITAAYVPWDVEVPAGKHKFRFHLSGGSTFDYECEISDTEYQIDTWKEEISHTDVEGQKDFTMVTNIYLSTTGIHFDGEYTNLYARYTDGYDWYTRNYKQYANKYISTIEII